MNRIQTLWVKTTPSRRLERLSRKSDTRASATPVHWQALRRSPKIAKAPTSTITGRVALIGPTMVSGRCFMPKYPKIHEVSTMADFRTTSPWASHVPGAVARRVWSNHPRPSSAERIAGRKNSVEKSVLSSSTGSTAFPVRAFFLAAS